MQAIQITKFDKKGQEKHEKSKKNLKISKNFFSKFVCTKIIDF